MRGLEDLAIAARLILSDATAITSPNYMCYQKYCKSIYRHRFLKNYTIRNYSYIMIDWSVIGNDGKFLLAFLAADVTTRRVIKLLKSLFETAFIRRVYDNECQYYVYISKDSGLILSPKSVFSVTRKQSISYKTQRFDLESLLLLRQM